MTKKAVIKKSRNKLGRYFFYAIILCYMLIRLVPIVSSSGNETSVAEHGNITVVDEIDAYIFRYEYMVKSVTEGSIKYLVRQGEKVEKGYSIAEISNDVVDDTTRKKLEVINQRIESLNNNDDDLFQSDVDKLNLEVNDIINNIKINVSKNDFLKVAALKRELQNKLQKKSVISGDESFAGKNMADLQLEQQQLVEQINGSIQFIKSSDSGIVSFYIDGYENILKPNNIEALELDKLSNMDQSATDIRTESVIYNQPLFKIVDNQMLYIAAWIDPKSSEHYKEGKTVTFALPHGEVKGTVNKKIENENNSLVIFMLKEYTEDLLIHRNLKIKTTVVNYEGLQIFTDSIIEKNDKKGVYVLDINRDAVFKPIQIIGINDQYAIIKSNVFYENKDGKTNTIETVKLYDEIVRNAEKVKEGQSVF